MTSTNYLLIKSAILGRLQVVALCDGHVRGMCPHAVGHRDGREHALLYQFDGQDARDPPAPGSPDNWRCMPVDALGNITLHAGPWHSCDLDLLPHVCFDEVDLAIGP
ncbi:MAG: hypothetical protein AB1642_04325 [Pseudomonadota bacterium]